jgi:hypothetical protein
MSTATVNAPREARMTPKKKGRPKKATGEGTPVRIDSDIASKARYLAALNGVPISEYLSQFLRAPIDREFRKAGANIIGESEGEGGSK